MLDKTKSILLLPTRMDDESQLFFNQICSLNKQSFKSLKANDKDKLLKENTKQKLDQKRYTGNQEDLSTTNYAGISIDKKSKKSITTTGSIKKYIHKKQSPDQFKMIMSSNLNSKVNTV